MSARPTIATRKAALHFLTTTDASYTEAAARFGVSRSILSRWWRDEGLPPRRSGPRTKARARTRGKPDELVLTGRWVRDGLIMRHVPEGAA